MNRDVHSPNTMLPIRLALLGVGVGVRVLDAAVP